MPTLTVVAGPNGSGKSTLTKWNRERFQSIGVLDPDAIARSTEPKSGLSQASAIDAGRAVLTLANQMLEAGQSFVVETTLSGNTYLRMMRDAKKLGYETELLFVGTSSIDVNLNRVALRVIKGGHDVPIDDQMRRYPRSMRNVCVALELADNAILYDNSTAVGFTKIAVKDADGVKLFEPLPDWAAFLRKL